MNRQEIPIQYPWRTRESTADSHDSLAPFDVGPTKSVLFIFLTTIFFVECQYIHTSHTSLRSILTASNI
jgi:hypothetical protein